MRVDIDQAWEDDLARAVDGCYVWSEKVGGDGRCPDSGDAGVAHEEVPIADDGAVGVDGYDCGMGE